MNKTINTVLIIVLSMLIMTLNVTNSRSLVINGLDYPTDINMLVFADSSEPLFISYNGLISNYTEADNTISVVNNEIWDFASDDLSGYDALFVSISGLQIFDNVENPEVVAI
ncbi:MAG: hypothetical protein HeimC2_20450 [Candidatus Heimdallarchaeota archaeon LC_2]|nr:MAG: hypothetical protein HeimC2_20450 [Candidatus Heimdallarchaeota archaeon LC_2]